MSHNDYYWFIRPDNEHTNEQLTKALDAVARVPESASIDETGFGKYRVPPDFLKQFYKLKGQLTRFTVYRQRKGGDILRKVDMETLPAALENYRGRERIKMQSKSRR